MNYFVAFCLIVACALCCASATGNTRKDRKSLKEQIIGLNYTIYNLMAALKKHEDLMANLSPSAKLKRVQELETVAVGTSTEEATTLAEDFRVNSYPLIKLQQVEELENVTVGTSTTLAEDLEVYSSPSVNTYRVDGIKNATIGTSIVESTTLAKEMEVRSSPTAKSHRVEGLESVTIGTTTEESTTLAEDVMANLRPQANTDTVQGLENETVETSPVTTSTLAADLIAILAPNETSVTDCVEFMELDKTAEISRSFANITHSVSCMWVVWAKQGGPITIHSLSEDNDAEGQQLHSNISVFVLNHNFLFGEYNVTKLDLGMNMNFSTDYLNARGFYPFVIIHVLALPTESVQRVHLQLWDQGGGFKFELSKTLHETNPLKTWKSFVDFPLQQNDVRVMHDRQFLLVHASHDKSVRLTIAPKGRLPIIDFVEIQVSWLNITSRSVEQRSYNNGMRKGKIEIDLEPSTPFVVAFSSLQEGDVTSSFHVGYKYY